MKKIMLIVVMCLMLVGCGKQTALDITKENYEKYGYNYASMELEKIKLEVGEKYTDEDVADAIKFLAAAEYGINLDDITEDRLNSQDN